MKSFKSKYNFKSSWYDILQADQEKDTPSYDGAVDTNAENSVMQNASEIGKNYINFNTDQLTGDNSGELNDISEIRDGVEYEVRADNGYKTTEKRGRILAKHNGIIYDISRNACHYKFTDQDYHK